MIEKYTSTIEAIKELHKPQSEYYPGSNEGIDLGYDFKLYCRTCSTLYPCRTMQAIDKLTN